MPAIRNIIFATGIAALSAIAAVGTQAIAGGPGGPFGAEMTRFAQALDLSEDQEHMVAEMREAGRAHIQASRIGKQQDKEDIREMLSQESLDADVVHGLIDERIDEMASFAHDMADKFIALHATLDADQRATLIEKMEAAGERHEERRRRHIEQRSMHSDQ